MAEEKQTQDSSADYFADLNVRLQDMEEKQNMIKDRVLLLGENLVSSKDELENEITDLKLKILDLNSEMKKVRLTVERMIDDSNNFIRKNEFDILKRQFEMFQPLELARMTDVRIMIEKALKIKNSK